MGPLTNRQLDRLNLRALNAQLSENSGDVIFEVYSGHSAESALASTPNFEGTWTKGRNRRDYIRRSGHAHYIKVSTQDYFGIEIIQAELEPLGMIQRRTF